MTYQKIAKLNLLKTITTTIEFLSRSEESDWCSTSPELAATELRNAIDRIFGKSEIKASDINYLFGPTGPLQEIAMSNGWHDEYLILAEEWDATKDQIA